MIAVMTPILDSNDESSDLKNMKSQPVNGLTMSPRLRQAVETLSVLPEFRAIAREQGEPAMILEATKLLRATRPELFDAQNPGDLLARLFADLESGNR